VPAEVAARLAEHLGEDDLTARELEVLRAHSRWLSHKQIADQLAIAETTVNFHVKNLVAKLQAKDRTHCGDDRASARPAPDVAKAPVDSYRIRALPPNGAGLAWRNYCRAVLKPVGYSVCEHFKRA